METIGIIGDYIGGYIGVVWGCVLHELFADPQHLFFLTPSLF